MVLACDLYVLTHNIMSHPHDHHHTCWHTYVICMCRLVSVMLSGLLVLFQLVEFSYMVCDLRHDSKQDRSFQLSLFVEYQINDTTKCNSMTLCIVYMYLDCFVLVDISSQLCNMYGFFLLPSLSMS